MPKATTNVQERIIMDGWENKDNFPSASFEKNVSTMKIIVIKHDQKSCMHARYIHIINQNGQRDLLWLLDKKFCM